MNIVCPGCALSFPVIAGINDADARRVASLMGEVPPRIAANVLVYIHLFKPEKSGLSWSRVCKLLGELVPDIKRGQINRHRRDWIAPVENWNIALEEMIARRHKLTLPIKSHGYLYEILAALADKAEGVVERQREQQRRHRSPTDIAGDLKHLKNMIEMSSSPVVKEAIQRQVDQRQAELEAAKGGNSEASHI